MNDSSFSARRALVSAVALTISGWLTTFASAEVVHVWPGDSIQYAIGKSDDGDVIIVHQGRYEEGSIEMQGKAITLRSEDPTDPLVVVSTQITPPLLEPGIRCVNGEEQDTVISGFVFYGAVVTDDGGAMIIQDSSPTVRYCTFFLNYCFGSGGAMRINGGAPLITNCTFDYNMAEYSGGAIRLDNSEAAITNCRFINNEGGVDISHPTYGAGAVFGLNCDLSITDCLFTGNSSDSTGGAVFLFYGNGIVTNCKFIDNLSDYFGGGLAVAGDSFTVSGCEFIGNVAASKGGGIYLESWYDATVTGCTVFGNTGGPDGGGGIDCHGTGEKTIAHTQICGNWDDQICGEYTDGGGNLISDVIPPPPPQPDPPDPVGACCLPGGLCMIGTEAHCIEAGGAYEGDDTDCQTADCPEPCPGDIDGDGDVDTADLLALLGAWGACP